MKLLEWLKIVGMGLVIILLCEFIRMTVRIDNAVTKTLPDTMNSLNTSVKLLPKIINDTRLTLDNVNKGAIDERMYFERTLPVLMAGVQDTITHTNELLVTANHNLIAVGNDLHNVASEIQRTTEAVRPALTESAATLASTNEAIRHLDALITAPEIKVALANTASMTTSGAAIAADGQVVADKFAHPAPRHGWAKLYGPVLDLSKLAYDFLRATH